MALEINKNVNFYGNSHVMAENEMGNEYAKIIVSLNANYNGVDKKVYFSKTIEDVVAYHENKEMCDADSEAFEQQVLDAIGNDVEVVEA